MNTNHDLIHTLQAIVEPLNNVISDLTAKEQKLGGGADGKKAEIASDGESQTVGDRVYESQSQHTSTGGSVGRGPGEQGQYDIDAGTLAELDRLEIKPAYIGEKRVVKREPSESGNVQTGRGVIATGGNVAECGKTCRIGRVQTAEQGIVYMPYVLNQKQPASEARWLTCLTAFLLLVSAVLLGLHGLAILGCNLF